MIRPVRRFSPALLTTTLLMLASCGRGDGVPEPGTDQYVEAVAHFYTAVASIQSGQDLEAEEQLQQAADLAPGEPAVWANLGLLALRRNENEAARQRLTRAAELAPENGYVQFLLSRLEANEGNFEAAIAHLRQATEFDPDNARAKYALAQEIERQGAPGWEAEVQRLLDELLAADPDNLALLVDAVRLAGRRGDQAAVDRRTARLDSLSAEWPEEVREQLTSLQSAGSIAQVSTQATFLRNALLRLPVFREDLSAVQAPAQEVGDLMVSFVKMEEPENEPAAPDLEISYATEPFSQGGPWKTGRVLWLTGDGESTVALLGEQEIQMRDLSVPVPPGMRYMAPLDYDYDFRSDLFVAGPGGFRLFHQEGAGSFQDVTARMNLPADAVNGAYTGAWAADVDMEGDLDLVMGTESGAPVVLRNNGDGTFTVTNPFPGLSGIRDFAWADLDGDGDPDAALLDGSGRAQVIINERNGLFRAATLPESGASAQAITAADLDSDGRIDVILLGPEGSVIRLSRERGREAWTSTTVGTAGTVPGADARLLTPDLDNNGALDVIATWGDQTRILLGRAEGALQPLPGVMPVAVQDVSDLNQDGRMDLLGLNAQGEAVQMLGRGTKEYHWQFVRPRAARATGDQRINTFGIGGVVEVRSGLLYQQQVIREPVVHFGLGEKTETDVARIIWPNGDIQAEFGLAVDEHIGTPQRLKGSCPWLFTHDGEGLRFVTDFIWRSPLGLRINAQETAGVMTTEDWVKIPGDALKPKDGFYDLRITAELWETHFFDHVSLLVVDHPVGTEVIVDERFAFPPPPLAVHPAQPLKPVARVLDTQGRDITEVVRGLDERYHGASDLTKYQGIAGDHFVEVELGEEVPREGKVVLVGNGWIRPTDSSINVALSQGQHGPPTGLTLEVPDGKGGWRTAKAGLGFPAGKTKTVLIDLEDVFTPGTRRRLRLRTNLEIYWDRLAWTVLQPDVQIQTQRLALAQADLRYRGFSALAAKDRQSPELPEYAKLEGTAPRWRDLEGYYTRFGDVRELLGQVDDRYVIMNAGDEMRFLFPEAAPLRDGWVRDYVLVGDGWVKDGDYNTQFSRTVLPLPAHDQPEYNTPPTRLEDDPVYQRHASDWQQYHTRYVAPEAFRDALVVQE